MFVTKKVPYNSKIADLKTEFGSLPPSISEASKIFSLWLRQSSLDFFVEIPEFFSSLGYYLLSKKRLPRLASPLQVFRLVLESIAAGDLTSSVCCTRKDDLEKFTPPALVSIIGDNLLSGIPNSAVEWLQHSAQRDLATLTADLSNGLIAILIRKRTFLSFFDHFLTFPKDKQLTCVLERSRNQAQIAANSGDTSNVATEYLTRILKIAIKDRITILSPSGMVASM